MEISLGQPLVAKAKRHAQVFRWVGLCALLFGFAVLVERQVSSVPPELSSNGVRLTTWLRDARYGYLRPGDSDETIRFVAGFGKDAIPRLIHEYHTVGSRRDRFRQMLAERLPGGKKEPSNEAQRRLKALTALAVLGCRYPKEVEPVMAKLTALPECGQVLKLLGRLGPHYVPLLTRIIATSTRRNAGIAIESLSLTGTNAQSAIPVVLRALERQWREEVFYSEDAALVERMGPVPRAEVERLLVLLNDPEPVVRRCSARFLAGLKSHRPIIAAEMKRLAMLPIVAGHDPGQWTVRLLPQVGVPAREGVPLLELRLRTAIEQRRWIEAPDSAYAYTGALAQYGAAARELAPLVTRYLYPEALRRADPSITTDPEKLEWAKGILGQLETWLRQMDASWRPPPAPAAHRRAEIKAQPAKGRGAAPVGRP